MLTPRGWWTLAVSLVMALVGLTALGNFAPAIPILGMTLFLWMLAELLLFTVRYRAIRNSIIVEREILQGGRSVATTWAKSPTTIRVRITNLSLWRWPLVFLRDRLPEGRKTLKGQNTLTTDLRPDEPVVIEYELRSNTAGLFRFEGLELRVTDLAGLFYRRYFIRSSLDVLILPPLADDEGKQRADKRFNTLPPPGLHRLRRPGGGSELLDLRDYRPGDPPKMIAWKPSAKKDKLITKEYESDVPVRTMLFLDCSQSVRIGPANATPISKLVETASGIAQAAAASRDLVGLTRFDEEDTDVMKPARTTVHTIRMLGKLAESAALIPDPGPKEIHELEDLAYPLAQELYPELFDKEFNRRPFLMHWIPLLDTKYGWMAVAPLMIWLGVIFLNFRFALNTAGQFVRLVRPPKSGSIVIDIIAFVVLLIVGFLWPFFLIFLGTWIVNGLRGYLPRRRRVTRRRKTLGTIFATIDNDSPGMIERYIRDEEFYSARLGRFLAEHHVRIPPKLYTEEGQYRYQCPTKAIVLSDAILAAVARAKDNELYVLLADLGDLGDELEPILKAVRVARGRHHHVMVVVPWPEDVGTPVSDQTKVLAPKSPVPDSETARKHEGTLPPSGKLIRHAMTLGYQYRYDRLRTELARVGAGVVRVSVDDPVRVVLDRIDRLRGLRSRR